LRASKDGLQARSQSLRGSPKRLAPQDDGARRDDVFCDLTAGFWLNLQTQFDIATAEKAIGKALAKIVPVSRNAA
jgi:hypothetical protein